MRRLIRAAAVTVALTLSVAAPVVAAPEQNPALHTVTVTCGDQTWEVISAKAGLGWLSDGPAGTTPDKLVGGTLTFTFNDGSAFTATIAPPAGLEGKFETCTLEGWGPGHAFYEVWDPAYIKLTPH
jgi:hypothetical protein